MQIASRILAGLSVLALPITAAENAGFNAPIAGYARSADGIRPLMGIPGAAWLGGAVDLHGVQPLATDVGHGHAVGVDADGHIQAVQFATGMLVEVPNTAGAVTRIVTGPAGTTAAVVHPGQIDVITGLPDKPAVVRSVKISSDPGAVAISDNGEMLAVGNDHGFTLFGTSAQREIPSASAPGDLRFRSKSQEVIYTDGSFVRSASLERLDEIAGAADGLANPVSAIPLKDSAMLVIVDAGTSQLVVLHEDKTAERISLPCPTLSSADQLNSSTVELQCADGPAHLLQLSSAGARVFFIPEADKQ